MDYLTNVIPLDIFKYIILFTDKPSKLMLKNVSKKFNKHVTVDRKNIMLNTVEKGYLSIVQWLHRHGCPWNTNNCFVAIQNGHFLVLQWLLDNNCHIRKEYQQTQHSSVAIGYNAFYSQTQNSSVAVGYNALYSQTQQPFVAIGYHSEKST